MSVGSVTALLFEVDNQRYGLDVSQILEVVPAVHLRKIPGVPDFVSGVFSYRGTIVPVLDVSQMLAGRPAARRFSTRLVLVRYVGAAGPEHTLGLLVEGATQGLAEGIEDLVPSGIATPEVPCIGKVATQGGSIIQLLRIDRLIPDTFRERLFAED